MKDKSKVIDSKFESLKDHSYCPIKVINNKVHPDTPTIYSDGINNIYSNKTHMDALLMFLSLGKK